jgi:hypothetical protein
VIQKQKPQRNAEADCLVNNCEHYRVNNTSADTVPTTVVADMRTVTNNIVAMSIALVYHQYDLALEHAIEMVNAMKRIQQKRGEL